jgi:hypothetical protein
MRWERRLRGRRGLRVVLGPGTEYGYYTFGGHLRSPGRSRAGISLALTYSKDGLEAAWWDEVD